MSTSYQGASGPSGYAGSRPAPVQPPSQERFISDQIRKLTDAFLEQHRESSVTREKIDTLLERFDRLGLGMDDGDTVDKQESTRSDTLLIALKQIEGKLQGASDRVENAGYMGSNEDTKVVSDLMDYIRETIIDCQDLISESNVPGESPPPPPRACFGRDDLIEKIIGLAENLTPLALIGPGGNGKTSIALTVLHHDHIKKRFGTNRRFIRCDQFPASRTHFLSRLSKVIGAGVENPEDLTPLRPFLSSWEIILILDNAESILDPQEVNGQEIYATVEELSEFSNICLCITSRISTIPPACEILDIPTLSTEAARDTFYRIYKNGEQSDPVNNMLEQLDFHPLSITLLATVSQHNRWGTNRLTKEWNERRTGVLHTRHKNSLATTIELSLNSPMFQELGPEAQGVLGVIAFFPQGIDENNLDWLFPTISNRTDIFDTFCVLSLTYRSNGFVTMLAPLRDHLCPKDPASSPLLCTTRDHYFRRLSVYIDPGSPGFEEAGWIASEDVNVEHLLDVFTSVDAKSVGVWTVCARFMMHLYWHKKRLVSLGPKIEGLPDSHRSKPECLFELSRLFTLVGNHVERKRLIVCTLEIWRKRGNDLQVAHTLRSIAGINNSLRLYEEAIEQGEEALEIYERLNHALGQAYSWHDLAWAFHGDGQVNAAEEAALRGIDLLSDRTHEPTLCNCHRLLGDICCSRGEVEKAIDHYETALGIASPLDHDLLFWTHHSLAELFLGKNRFNDGNTHIERAKSHAIDGSYNFGRAMELQTRLWYREGRFEEAKSEASRAAATYAEVRATMDAERCKALLQNIEERMKTPAPSGESNPSAQGSGHRPTSLQTYPPPNNQPHVWTKIQFLAAVFLFIAATPYLPLFSKDTLRHTG